MLFFHFLSRFRIPDINNLKDTKLPNDGLLILPNFVEDMPAIFGGASISIARGGLSNINECKNTDSIILAK